MKEFDDLVEIFRILRGPQGCPWDKAQNHFSILQCAVDEVYEFLEAAENQNDANMREELGDLLLQVVFHSQMAAERGAFGIREVIAEISEKLRRRHPHVFASGQADTPEKVLTHWETIKRQEKPERTSVLDGIPRSLPALFKAEKMQRKAAKAGFDWPDISPVLDKVREEFEEFSQAVKSMDSTQAAEELGDILFSLVNVARHCQISAEEALRKTIDKFSERFHYVEKKIKEQGKTWDASSLLEMDRFWEESKTILCKGPNGSGMEKL